MIPLPSDLPTPLVEVFYLHGHPPVICGWHGAFDPEMHGDIQGDLDEDESFKENGTYVFEAHYIEAQIGDEGRIELPGYWDLSLLRFKSIEEN